MDLTFVRTALPTAAKGIALFQTPFLIVNAHVPTLSKAFLAVEMRRERMPPTFPPRGMTHERFLIPSTLSEKSSAPLMGPLLRAKTVHPGVRRPLLSPEMPRDDVGSRR